MSSELHHRRSIRLSGYDYTQSGAYFITICVHQRVCLFGDIVNGVMRLNDTGRILRDEWLQTAALRPYVSLDEFAIMPNHLHGIIVLTDTISLEGTARRARTGVDGRIDGLKGTDALEGTARRAPTGGNGRIDALENRIPWRVERFGRPVSGSIPTVVRAFKSAATKRINEQFQTPGAKIWQRNYYEHVIRNEDELDRIRHYIAINAMRWAFDKNNPDAVDIEPEAPWRI